MERSNSPVGKPLRLYENRPILELAAAESYFDFAGALSTEQVELTVSGREAGGGKRQAGHRGFASGGHLQQPMSRPIQFVELRHRTGKKRVPLSSHAIVEHQAKLETTGSSITAREPLGETPRQERHRPRQPAPLTAIGGTIELLTSVREKRQVVEHLIGQYEPSMEAPWKLDPADEKRMGMLAGIVCFRVRVEKVEAKFKMNQNKSSEDQRRVLGRLRKRGGEMNTAVADLMETLLGQG